MIKFIVSVSTNSGFRFNVETLEKKIILKSESYTTSLGCKNGIESVRRNALEDKRFERKNAKEGFYFFNLKAGNGQIVASSGIYNSANDREFDIILLMNYIYNAKIEELV